jgi:formate-dependent nitrite reductase membrane component NrfD
VHNPQVWGWPVIIDMFLGGLAAGVMIISVLAARRAKRDSLAFRLLPFAAPVAISLALLALFLDLENKAHAFRFFTTLRVTSPMSWGSWILLLTYPATILYGLSRLDVSGRIADWARAHAAFLARANVILGIALGTYTGVLLTSAARPAWASIVIAPLFLASAVVTGAAFCKLAPIDGEEQVCVCRWLIGAIAAEAVMLFAWFVDLRALREAVFTAPMWALVVIAGLAAPALMHGLELRGRGRPLIAPILLLFGGIALRWVVISAGQVAL